MKSHVHSGQFIRRYALLDPLDKSLELANRLWARASSTMANSRGFEIAIEVLHISDFLANSLVVILSAVREDEVIGQAVPGDQLAVASFE